MQISLSSQVDISISPDETISQFKKRLKDIKDIVFESENPDIATFENGVLKGVSVGKTTISIMIKNKLNTRKYIYMLMLLKE